MLKCYYCSVNFVSFSVYTTVHQKYKLNRNTRLLSTQNYIYIFALPGHYSAFLLKALMPAFLVKLFIFSRGH